MSEHVRASLQPHSNCSTAMRGSCFQIRFGTTPSLLFRSRGRFACFSWHESTAHRIRGEYRGEGPLYVIATVGFLFFAFTAPWSKDWAELLVGLLCTVAIEFAAVLRHSGCYDSLLLAVLRCPARQLLASSAQTKILTINRVYS